MKVEILDCPRCHNESVDVVLEHGEIEVIGGCISCDYMPTVEEINE